MCTKHDACLSKNSTAKISGTSCSAPGISAIKSMGTESSSSCCSSKAETSCCSSGGATDDESESSGLEALYTHSWQVVGMDCPSCAKKVETAVSRIKGVQQVKVLFATEKLVVQTQLDSLAGDIESAVNEAGFSLSSGKPAKSEPQDFSLTGILKQNIQVVALSAAMAISFILRDSFPELSRWAFIAICLIGLFPIASKAIQLARSGSPFSIETLMSVAALGALYLGETIEAAMVLLLFLLGEKLEAFAASRARSGVQSLMALVPEEAVKIIDGQRVTVAAESLQPDDVIEVAPGARLPADGRLQSAASFDESALTGESVPVEHLEGEQVMAGSVVVDRVVRITVTSQQGENAIDRILHLIEEAESHKAPIERFLDRFSRWYTPLMMVLAVLVIITPPLLFAQPWETWVYRGLALLLIACPCALVISTPAAITSGLAVAAKRGALIKGGAALESLGNIEVVAFDKTGTLTQGKPRVTDVLPLGEITQQQLIQLAAAIEVGSSHPLAVSLVKHAKQQGISLPEAEQKQALAGVGVSGVIAGEQYQILSPSKADIQVDQSALNLVEALESEGKTLVYLVRESDVIGVIGWQDTLREDAKQAVADLHAIGVRTVMLTGDHPRSAQGISNQIGVEFEAGLLPEDKVRYVREYSENSQLAMVGDGINDAPAMKAASVGIAMGGGTDVALETAEAALTHNRLTELAAMIQLSQATLKNIRQNITLALGLKGVFLVTSLFGITGLWVAVLADSGATVLVTLNALRLLKYGNKASRSGSDTQSVSEQPVKQQ
ncbi:zinc/cadmium/mercury/lead-transporting ATPase [Vibrio sp. SCSIO 43137]|uniref:zinc/cadmium/mercury/lead-transporting ATPase n=1 Tax=Vibrio sp. SCSIO 43137 TaxID=3021011 RepID=UPI0023071955|nr:zinc/cadmium/mercury/lead-transporting ATPase [Vibrio sp. SCSIO 43137]WCE28640.1 zinc/cadmium/mercury/lead-transporting ATPase [Vibrio sp. SCSIO 43137]